MAYTKQTWATGDTVTAAKLNHMEDGIADGSYDLEFISVENSKSMEYSLKGMSFEELWEKAITKHEILTIKLCFQAPDGCTIRTCTDSVNCYEDDGAFVIQWNDANMTSDDNVVFFTANNTDFIADYNSTTGEYTLTKKEEEEEEQQ